MAHLIFRALDRVNIRSGPSLKAQIEDSLAKGERIACPLSADYEAIEDGYRWRWSERGWLAESVFVAGQPTRRLLEFIGLEYDDETPLFLPTLETLYQSKEWAYIELNFSTQDQWLISAFFTRFDTQGTLILVLNDQEINDYTLTLGG